MARPITPFLWLTFSAGGTVAALLYPIHLFLTGIAFPLGWIDPPSYEFLRALVAHPLTRLYLFVFISLPLFHWAHRFRYTLYDGLQQKHLTALIAVLCYGTAFVGAAIAAATLWRIPLSTTAHAAGTPSAMIDAAKAFLASLGPAESPKAAMAFASDERFNWHYTAKLRNGLPLKQMSDAQRKAATDLLRAALSQVGFEKAETIRRLEDVLRAIEGNPGRDPEMYYFNVFGEPSAKGVWSWRYEGHHVSLNFTLIDGKVVATTPQFLGANPAEVKDGPMKGTRALAREEDLARTLAKSLSAEQRALGITSATAPPEILTAASRDASLQQDVGIPYAKLDRDQRGLLDSLIEEYLAAQRPDLAKLRRDKIQAAGLDTLKFVWMGSLEKGQGHYYRVQGATFLIEYDNTQNGANHVHTVWRDFKGDWGKDVLAEHYSTSSHHAEYRRRQGVEDRVAFGH